MDFQDRELSCMDCGQTFVFTAGEQQFYDRKGFKEEPKRCKPCRENRKVRRGQGPAAGGQSSDEGGNSNGNGAVHASRFSDDDGIGNRAGPPRGPEVREMGGSRGGRELHDAVCAQCGAAARVPFKPVAGRPVYCRDCFANRGVG